MKKQNLLKLKIMKINRFIKNPMKLKKLWKLPMVVLITLALAGCESPLLEPDESGNLVPKTVAEDPMLPRIQVNGTMLHAEAFGDINNPVIIFLHGGPGGDYRALISQKGLENASRYPNERSIFNGGLSQLQDEYYCVFYDQRGAGLSPRFDKGEVTFDIYIEDLDAIIDYYLQKKENETGMVDNQVYLMGWSYGGILSTGYINKYPSRVKDVALFESGPFSKEVWDYFKDNITSPFGQIGEDWLEEYLLSHDHFTPDGHIRSDYQKLLGAAESNPEFHQDVNTPYWRVGALIGNEDLGFRLSTDYDITSNLSAFNGKMLFIGSDKVLSELPEYPGLQMKYYPKSELVTVSGVGHTGPWEKPNEVASLIRNYFQKK
jgi:proline iminopeptidase